MSHSRLISRRRPTLAFSTWFCIAEENMKDLEILNRASAIIVPAKSKSLPYKYHIVTCSHVVAPWKWPKYYPEDWISAVNENHTHYTVEMRQDDGMFCTQQELVPTVYHHPTRDLAVLHLDSEDVYLETMDEVGVLPWGLFPGNMQPLPIGHAVEFSGHELRDKNMMAGPNDEDTRVPIPRLIRGSIEGASPHQFFCRSQSILSQGMCGGPVLVDIPNQSSIANTRPVTTSDDIQPWVYGLVDGIVPTNHDNARLRGLVSYIPSHIITSFLNDVENGLVEGVEGGPAARYVGADQDPEKMDMEAILKKYG